MGRLKFSNNLKEAVTKSELIFICVGTPNKVNSKQVDLSYVFKAVKEVAKAITIDGLPNVSSFMKNYQESGAGYDDTKEYIDPEFPEEPSGPTQQMIDDNTIGIGELK